MKPQLIWSDGVDVIWTCTAWILCLLIVSFVWAEGKNTPEITVVGKLVNIVAIGGETTGWALDLESDLKIAGKKVTRIEVDPARKQVDTFKDKRVEVRGKLSWGGGGPERGYYPMIEVETIRELKP